MSDDELFALSEIETPVDKSRKATGRPFDSKITIRKAVAGWQLCTDGVCGVLPAGGRLLRGKPWPIDRFIFDTEEEAREAGEALATYLGTSFQESSTIHENYTYPSCASPVRRMQ